MNREMLQTILMRHVPYSTWTGIECECRYFFPVEYRGCTEEDPRTSWAKHVVSAIYPES